MKDFWKQNGLKIASYGITLAGVVLGIVEGKISEKQQKQEIAEAVKKYIKEVK